MLLKGYEIDKEGYYIGDYLYEEDNVPELENVIITEMPQGFFKSKWNGTEWVEGATQEYIDIITNK
ncbi:hypothetical protein [Clostridium sp.]|uniref:hypothetical protein n=1 Tax=Clostridium sp. TaxID=1506 RepID=UPI0026094399|nr:hypothetical protein [Clostridium sp.]